MKKILITSFFFVNTSLACTAGTKTKLYNCKNDLDGSIAKKANMEVAEMMKENPDACIKKTSNKVAEKYGCEVKVTEPKKNQ